MRTGTPGTNWDNPTNPRDSLWNGHLVTNLQREFEQWREVQLAQEHVAAAMTYQIGRTMGERQEVLRASEREVLGALRAWAGESEAEIKRKLAGLLETTPDEVAPLALSMDRCVESPVLACVYPKEPEPGDRCLFCHLAYR